MGKFFLPTIKRGTHNVLDHYAVAVNKYSGETVGHHKTRAEQLIDLIDNCDYWEIIDVLTKIVISNIHMINKKSQIMWVILMPNVMSNLSQPKVYRYVT